MKTHHVKQNRDPTLADAPVYYIDYNIYIIIIIYMKKSLWLKYSMAEDELYSTAAGSPPLIYVSLCALEHR